MAYEQKPDTGTLFTNDRKAAENHPDYNGKLLISRDLLQKLAKYGEGMIEISAWIKETKGGKTIINLQCKEPYKKDDAEPRYKAGTPPQQYTPEVIHEPAARQQPPVTKAPPTSTDAQRYLDKLKISIAKITEYPDFETLYNKIHSPEIWQVFKTNPAIAQEASTILSVKKGQLILATEPVDLSAIISKIDVEITRLKLPAKQHCLARWDKSRAMLTPQELQVYLDELAIAKPIPPDDDFF
jgi:hypothetical protein